MNKKLFVLLPVAMLTLTGCSGDKDKDSEGEGEVKELVIDKSVISPFVPEGKTYAGEAFNFKVSGVGFAGSAYVGCAAAHDGKDSGYNELGAIQLKKDAGEIKNTDEYAATKIVIEWIATYSEEESKYWPKAFAGESTSLTQVAAAEPSDTKLVGTDTGKKEYFSDKDKSFGVYKFTSTFNLPANTKYFSVTDSGGATYVTKITVSK